LHLRQYNRTYAPAAPPEQGVWGLFLSHQTGLTCQLLVLVVAPARILM
jgi:hypothetical protein